METYTIPTSSTIRTWAGHRGHKHHPELGTVEVLFDGHAQGINSPGDGDYRWVLFCDRHNTFVSVETLAHAKDFLRHSDTTEFCGDCYDLAHDHNTEL
jgi:hypothetical protein